MRAELWASTGYVAGFDIPPFNAPPLVLTWGARAFVREGAGTILDVLGPHAHLVTCQSRVPHDPPKECNCGGVFAYTEAASHVLMDMHRLDASRDKPLTERAKG